MRKLIFFVLILLCSASLFAQAPQTLRAEIKTTMGTINCELFPDKAPITVDNFVGLATGSKEWRNPASHAKMVHKPLYDGTIFHRVINGFMIQGGDPMGNGAGDPGYTIPDEFNNALKFDQPGRLAMANEGRPHTGGSQFFITQVPTPHLNGRHTIFGQCGPMTVINAIARTPTDPEDRPFHPVKIIHVSILKPGQSVPSAAAPATPKHSSTPAKTGTAKKPTTAPKK